MPEYAHLPLLLTTDRKKLSKRHNHASVEYYKTEAGVLPAALANFVAMLGWSPHGAWAVLIVVGRVWGWSELLPLPMWPVCHPSPIFFLISLPPPCPARKQTRNKRS